MGKKQLVTIKGTRDGLTLYLDDACSFEELLNELDSALANNHGEDQAPMITVKVQLGNRYLHKDQEESLREVVRKKNNLVVETVESNVITKQQALDWMEDSEVKIINKIIRSGQVLEVKGDMLLIGDVNSGGKVVASGNIFVMGTLRGVAHAGSEGNRQAVVAASHLLPSQLRIADYISRSPDYQAEGVYMECGLIDEESSQIVIERLQSLVTKRPDINGFKRRMMNG